MRSTRSSSLRASKTRPTSKYCQSLAFAMARVSIWLARDRPSPRFCSSGSARFARSLPIRRTAALENSRLSVSTMTNRPLSTQSDQAPTSSRRLISVAVRASTAFRQSHREPTIRSLTLSFRVSSHGVHWPMRSGKRASRPCSTPFAQAPSASAPLRTDAHRPGRN